MNEEKLRELAEGLVEALRSGNPGAGVEELENIAQTTCVEYTSNENEADRLYDAMCKLLEQEGS
jgi:hypothetical protein